ncbi:MarR family winged helix-turn-helix transcriptional regulator [Streptomyces sp. A1136]|uniref:MarR family winged helix-turn-helix transcriptional regulator n=1 Tax=Streptomyces sp. A1136 TaxID=2563102 RepID=UPI00109EBBF6|nr:MarR family winged helix-turn-helix transcriptional regulator [Streptomyces sp. A1136]THA47091.1 MarR family transcriptional regulator [Streptomyces sp. A1136]
MAARTNSNPAPPTGPGAGSEAEAMVCYTVPHAARLLGQAISHRLTALGVTTGQLPALLALYATDGQTQSELARRTGVEQPTMAVNLRRMERDGLITRTPDPADARRALVHLTDKARTIQTDVQAIRSGIDAEALTGFTHEEHNQLTHLLDRLVTNLQHLTDGPPDTNA